MHNNKSKLRKPQNVRRQKRKQSRRFDQRLPAITTMTKYANETETETKAAVAGRKLNESKRQEPQ